jgi:hypothetical protein
MASRSVGAMDPSPYLSDIHIRRFRFLSLDEERVLASRWRDRIGPNGKRCSTTRLAASAGRRPTFRSATSRTSRKPMPNMALASRPRSLVRTASKPAFDEGKSARRLIRHKNE